MDAASIPVKMPVIWGASAGGGYIRTVPVPSQIGINNGYASFTDGWVPLNFVNPDAGGIPPYGQDMNGAMNAITAWNQWQQAGAPVFYDAAFATGIGGYPKGAILSAVGIQAGYWWNEVDNNTSNPDTGGANWFFIQMGNPSTYVAVVPQTTFYVNNVIGNDTTGNGLTTGTAWATIPHAIGILSGYSLNGQTVTIQLANTGVNYQVGQLAIRAPSSGLLVIQGNASSQSSYILNGSPAAAGAVIEVFGGNIQFVGLTIQHTVAHLAGNLVVYNGGTVSLMNVSLTTTATGASACMNVQGGSLTVGSGCLANASGQYLILTEFAGQYIMSANFALSGTPTYTIATAAATSGGVFYLGGVGGWVFTGSGAIGQRYSTVLAGILNTGGGGANFFPGNSAGVATSPGAYA